MFLLRNGICDIYCEILFFFFLYIYKHLISKISRTVKVVRPLSSKTAYLISINLSYSTCSSRCILRTIKFEQTVFQCFNELLFNIAYCRPTHCNLKQA